MKTLLITIFLLSAGTILAEDQNSKDDFKLTKKGFLFCENDYLKQNYRLEKLQARLLIQSTGKDILRVLIIWRDKNKISLGDIFRVKRVSSKVHVLENITGEQDLTLELDELDVEKNYEASGVLKTQGWLGIREEYGSWPLRCTKKVDNINVSLFKGKYF